MAATDTAKGEKILSIPVDWILTEKIGLKESKVC